MALKSNYLNLRANRDVGQCEFVERIHAQRIDDAEHLLHGRSLRVAPQEVPNADAVHAHEQLAARVLRLRGPVSWTRRENARAWEHGRTERCGHLLLRATVLNQPDRG